MLIWPSQGNYRGEKKRCVRSNAGGAIKRMSNKMEQLRGEAVWWGRECGAKMMGDEDEETVWMGNRVIKQKRGLRAKIKMDVASIVKNNTQDSHLHVHTNPKLFELELSVFYLQLYIIGKPTPILQSILLKTRWTLLCICVCEPFPLLQMLWENYCRCLKYINNTGS